MTTQTSITVHYDTNGGWTSAGPSAKVIALSQLVSELIQPDPPP